MGWDTQIIIIGENIETKETAKNIGKQIFDKDSKRYGKESFYIIEETSNISIFYTYERRKYAPYWYIEEISKTYPNVNFVILGSMLDFLCGPGGLFKITGGKIEDSYGIWGEESTRHRIICNPKEFKYKIYDWFKMDGKENELRINSIQEFPLGSCNNNLVDKVIPLDESEISLIIDKNESFQNEKDWIEQKLFEPILSQSAYEELRNKSKHTAINEESFIAFIAHSTEISEIETKVLETLDGEIFQGNPFSLYDRTFGPRSNDLFLLQSEFNYLEDIEDQLIKRNNDIINWGIKCLGNNENLKLAKGASITWLINLIKEAKTASS